MNLQSLAKSIKGQLYFDDTMRTLYATDASAYRELPLAVAIPSCKDDLLRLIEFARDNKTSIIPRAAGTSLAGQVVGNGIVVDISKHFTQILSVDEKDSSVWVQPGVIRDELNLHLKQFDLFYGPETSTSNRCMIAGMVGNNSCGSRSLIYGSAREHLLEVKAILADGSETTFKKISTEEFNAKAAGIGTVSDLETQIYKATKHIFSDAKNQQEIEDKFPKSSIPRRNTGYALDILGNMAPFKDGEEEFNFCKLIAGSEGTLAFITELKLNLVPVLPPAVGVVCIHFDSINEALKGNLEALKFGPTACELMDHYILECTKDNIEQRANRFFVQGDPKAILVVEIARNTKDEVLEVAKEIEAAMRSLNLGYHFPLVYGSDVAKVWTLRKAGLGLLSNIPGDAKAVAVIEDTAVDVQDLPEFIQEFNAILKERDLYCVHYAHAATGELHLRPIIDLKTQEGNKMFRTIATDIAHLVKKYKGSLSGEHGDGRLRGEFIPLMIGEHNYELCKKIKASWDPNLVFNPGKIVDTPPMDTFLRYMPGYENVEFKTEFNFDKNDGILRAAESCNGSGDCRKTELSGGTMCPSYMATKEEKHTTRARANILREVLTTNPKLNKFDSEEVKEVMDLCISCKGCKSECPSNVDMAKLKAEFTHQYYQTNKVSRRTKRFATVTKSNQLASKTPGVYNFMMKNALTSRIIKSVLGVAKERKLPLLYKYTLDAWFKKHHQEGPFKHGKVHLFNDEFTNYNDVLIGITSIKLLNKLGYQVVIPEHNESGRTYLSKGLLKEAKNLAIENVKSLSKVVSENCPIVGIEPSAILTLRDEYLDLVNDDLKAKAENLAENSFLIEEFLASELDKGNIDSTLFTDENKTVRLHGHCHQKALSTLVAPKKMLSLPKNYKVLNIPSGCCGMAGSFGYEKEHYDISMKMGELVLFPSIRKEPNDSIIAAAGTSCRHQIKDGTDRDALHPVEILWNALK